jgi:two-component system alkaline phosphatase synthesis response regulator PhoP
MKKKILVVEDEEGLRMALTDRVLREGYLVDSVVDGESALRKAISLPFDLIILDIMLPGRSGLDICHEIRGRGIKVPILLLTALGETDDRVVGLKIGADDYVTKPFEMLELLARIEALLRRPPSHAMGGIYRFGSVSVNKRAIAVTRAGRAVHLSAREFELLVYFLEHPGVSLTRDKILYDVWGYENGTQTRTVDVHVASLRQKLENDPKHPEFILTESGVGYKFSGQ